MLFKIKHYIYEVKNYIFQLFKKTRNLNNIKNG